MDFDSYAKLWPHQLDLLSGPLLEDDDDDDVDNQIDSELVSVQSTNSLSENSTNGDFPDSFESDDLTDVVCDKLRPPSKNAVHRFYVSGKNTFSPIKKAGLGMLVYVGRKHTARPDSDEEVDIETVEEELKSSPVKKGALSYRAFSRQVLSVLEDKEILHEVPNVIFANDVEKDTAVSNSSFENTLSANSCENSRDIDTNCSATETVKEEQNLSPARKSLLYHDFSREVLRVTEDKEILHDVPNLIFASDTEQDTTVSNSSSEKTKNTEIKCSTAVLQANDVNSLLEQFEASEGITSQDLAKPSSSLLDDNVIPVDDASNKSLPEKNVSPTRKKDISPYIIQKIKMSSAVKKGPILIPPSHQPKSKSRSSNHNSLETRKSCRSSNSSSPVNNKDCMSQSKNLSSHKYSFVLDHDHDYCSSSPSSSSENVDTKSYENDKGPDRSTNFVDSSFDSSESIPCESVNNIYKEMYFVPDAEVEIEVTESQADTTKQTVVKATSMSGSHCKTVAGTGSLKASCNARSDSSNDASKSCIQSSVETDQIESSSNSPRNFQSSPKKCLQTKVSVTPARPGTVGSVLVSDIIDEKNSYLQHNSNSDDSSASGKRRQGFPSPTSTSPNKKHCVWPLSNSHNFPQCDENIEDALWKRTRSPCVDNNGRPFWKSEKQKQIEERRVVYVGKLTEGMKVNDLRECFVRFGPIQDISIHFRESGDNYGFVTFFNRSDAYEVVERGRLDPKLRRFDLCFGGRRQFCRTRYSDLDSVDEGPFGRSAGDTDFDTLLQKAKAGSQNVRHHTTAS